jgi:hypothetical protein
MSYELDTAILTVRASGTPSLEDPQLLFETVREDPNIPRGALLLMDLRGLNTSTVGLGAVERLRLLLELLGPKLGWVCALIVDPVLAEDARTFQAEAKRMGLRVEIFSDAPPAEQWLRRYQSKKSKGSPGPCLCGNDGTDL